MISTDTNRFFNWSTGLLSQTKGFQHRTLKSVSDESLNRDLLAEDLNLVNQSSSSSSLPMKHKLRKKSLSLSEQLFILDDHDSSCAETSETSNDSIINLKKQLSIQSCRNNNINKKVNELLISIMDDTDDFDQFEYFDDDQVYKETTAPIGFKGKRTLSFHDNVHLVDGQIYTVMKSTETLRSIAARFGTTPSEIKSMNRLSRDYVFVGQILLIPLIEKRN